MKEKTELRKGLRYVGMLVAITAVGFVCGRLTAIGEDGLVELAATLENAIKRALPWIYVAVFAVLVALMFKSFADVKKLERRLTGGDGDDEILSQIEPGMHLPLLYSNLLGIVGLFLLLSCFTAMLENSTLYSPALYMVLPMMLTMASATLAIVIQKLTVDINRGVNPEKTLSVFDTSRERRQKFEEESDEIEKLKVYQSGFKAFRAMQRVCLVVMVCLIPMTFVFRVGMLPMFICTLVWVTGTIVYSLHRDKA